MKRGKTPFPAFAVTAFLIAVMIVAGLILYNPGTWADPASWKNLGVTVEQSIRAAKNGAENFASGIWTSNSGQTISERLQSHISQ